MKWEGNWEGRERMQIVCRRNGEQEGEGGKKEEERGKEEKRG